MSATKNFNFWYRWDGCFNFAKPSEREAQIIFSLRKDAPAGLRKSFVLPLDAAEEIDKDCTALDASEAANRYFNGLLWNNYRDELSALIEYLKSTERQDALDAKRWLVADLAERIASLTKERDSEALDLADMESES